MCAHSHTLLLSHPHSLEHSQARQHSRCHVCRDAPALSHLSTWPPVPAVISSCTHTPVTHAMCSPVCPITCAQSHQSPTHVHTRSHPHTRMHMQPLSEPPLHRCLGDHCRPAEPQGTGGSTEGAASTGLRPPQTHHTWIRDRSGVTPLVRHSPGIAGGARGAGDARGAGGPGNTRGRGGRGLFVPPSAGPP